MQNITSYGSNLLNNEPLDRTVQLSFKQMGLKPLSLDPDPLSLDLDPLSNRMLVFSVLAICNSIK